MPRRLFDREPPAGPERLLLPRTPVLRPEQGRCALGVCLQAALRLVDQEITYEYLLGLLGAAFMLRIGPEFGAELAVADRWQDVAPVLRALGRGAEVLAEPEAEHVLAVAESELRAGRPLLALGWGPCPLDWTLLVGRQGAQLLGCWPGSGAVLRRAPWSGSLLLTLGKPTGPANERETVTDALRRALGHLRDSADQYRAWEAQLAAEYPYGTPLQGRDRMLGEQWLVQCLVEARAAGAVFLRQAAGQYDETVGDLLTEAADLLEGVADDLEGLLKAPDLPGSALLAQDEEGLAARCRRLHAAAEREAEAGRRLAQALRVAGGEV